MKNLLIRKRFYNKLKEKKSQLILILEIFCLRIKIRHAYYYIEWKHQSHLGRLQRKIHANFRNFQRTSYFIIENTQHLLPDRMILQFVEK